MIWTPKFSITHRLLRLIREIGETLGAIRARRLWSPILERLTLEARGLSSHASTSIEGNPLPLTDVKRLLRHAPAQIQDTEREILNYNRALETLHAEVSSSPSKISSAFRESSSKG